MTANSSANAPNTPTATIPSTGASSNDPDYEFVVDRVDRIDEATLDLLITKAERVSEAQLSVLMAADARAVQLANMCIALSVGLVGVLLASTNVSMRVGAGIALVMVLAAALLEGLSARPGRLVFLPGWTPKSRLSDIDDILNADPQGGQNVGLMIKRHMLADLQHRINQMKKKQATWGRMSTIGMLLMLGSPVAGLIGAALWGDWRNPIDERIVHTGDVSIDFSLVRTHPEPAAALPAEPEAALPDRPPGPQGADAAKPAAASPAAEPAQ